MSDAAPKQTTRREVDVGEPVAAALSDYMVSVFGRRPTQDELNEMYWAAIEAVEKIGGPHPRLEETRPDNA